MASGSRLGKPGSGKCPGKVLNFFRTFFVEWVRIN